MPGIFAPLILFGGTLLGVWGYNHLLNNYEWKTPAFRTVSFATGLFGHTEYTKFTDGSQDVKIYPGLGHRYLDSRLLQDLDGDGTVDRIRENGGELLANSLRNVLVRPFHYQTNRPIFDEADRTLQDLMRQYP